MRAQFALRDGLQKSVDLILFAPGHEFYPAIAEISDRAGNVESFGNLANGITKADALDFAFVKDLNAGNHAPEIDPPGGRRQLNIAGFIVPVAEAADRDPAKLPAAGRVSDRWN